MTVESRKASGRGCAAVSVAPASCRRFSQMNPVRFVASDAQGRAFIAPRRRTTTLIPAQSFESILKNYFREINHAATTSWCRSSTFERDLHILHVLSSPRRKPRAETLRITTQILMCRSCCIRGLDCWSAFPKCCGPFNTSTKTRTFLLPLYFAFNLQLSTVNFP